MSVSAPKCESSSRSSDREQSPILKLSWEAFRRARDTLRSETCTSSSSSTIINNTSGNTQEDKFLTKQPFSVKRKRRSTLCERVESTIQRERDETNRKEFSSNSSSCATTAEETARTDIVSSGGGSSNPSSIKRLKPRSRKINDGK